MNIITFQEFPKITRLNRRVIITEKIDGTNAQIYITDEGEIIAGSRNRYLTPKDDNYGFAAWVEENKEALLKLGPGRHFGEWWGKGIQRGYNMPYKCFSMFNVIRWCEWGTAPKEIPNVNPKEPPRVQEVLPPCVTLVPVLFDGLYQDCFPFVILHNLKTQGSVASRGFSRPEGIVLYHVAANTMFKMTLEKDGQPKSL